MNFIFRNPKKPWMTKGEMNWPKNEPLGQGQSRKRRFLELCQEMFESLSPNRQIEELEALERWKRHKNLN